MYYIGVDIGGTYTKIGLVSEEWKVIKICKFPTDNNIWDKIVHETDSIFNEFEVSAVAVAIAGVVDKEGIVVQAANIPFFNNFPLLSRLKERYPLAAVRVENDATAATVAEALLGEGKNCKKFILLTLGTGIGGGLWVDGKVADFPMEVGHMTINYLGKSCICGNNGCLEAYASARAIKDNLIESIEQGQDSHIKNLYEGNFYKATSQDIYNLAMEGDPLCRSVLKEAGRALGSGMANLINIFAPEKIILTGGLSKASNIYLEQAIQEAKKRAMNGLGEKTAIVCSPLLDKGGILGAIALLRNQ